MIQKAVWYFIFCLALLSCHSNQNDGDANTLSTQKTEATPVKDTTLNYKIDTSKQVNNLLITRDTLLTADIKNNQATVKAYLSGIGKHVTIIVPVTAGDSLTAQIIPLDNKANIRFNQIFIPIGKTGKYDGPFSRSISYPITAKGNYKLIVGENLMAEDNWKGDFTCNILIKNK